METIAIQPVSHSKMKLTLILTEGHHVNELPFTSFLEAKSFCKIMILKCQPLYIKRLKMH